MPHEKSPRSARPRSAKTAPPQADMKIQDYARLQGLLLYQFMALKSSVIPFTSEMMELNRIGMALDPKQMLSDWTERQKSAINFQRFVQTFGKELFGSAVYDGEKLLAENDLFKLTHIPVKKGVEKRASMFHLGGFVPYSDNLFRLLPKANFFDRFIENGIDVYEMKCKCDTTRYNAQLLDLTVERIIESAHAFSDIAFEHAGREKMILEGYCGTGVHTYTAYLADPESMARKFRLITTFVSPLDAKQCTIFEQMHEILAYLNPEDSSVDGRTICSLLDTIQERVFEKTPMGALVHGWKNKEYAGIEKIEDLSHRQQSELAAWYWLSLEHGSLYPLSKDLYAFYSRLFTLGVSKAGVLPYEHKGQVINLNDLKKTGIKVLAFLGDKDHLVDFRTADVLLDILGSKQCEIVVHEKTGHVAYIFNPNRWQKDDPRAFKPDILETIFRHLPAESAAAKPAQPVKATVGKAPVKPEKTAVIAKPATVTVPPAPVKAKPAVAPAKTVPAKTTPAKAIPAKTAAVKVTGPETAAATKAVVKKGGGVAGKTAVVPAKKVAKTDSAASVKARKEAAVTPPAVASTRKPAAAKPAAVQTKASVTTVKAVPAKTTPVKATPAKTAAVKAAGPATAAAAKAVVKKDGGAAGKTAVVPAKKVAKTDSVASAKARKGVVATPPVVASTRKPAAVKPAAVQTKASVAAAKTASAKTTSAKEVPAKTAVVKAAGPATAAAAKAVVKKNGGAVGKTAKAPAKKPAVATPAVAQPAKKAPSASVQGTRGK